MPSSPQAVPVVVLFDYLLSDTGVGMSGQRVTVVLNSTAPATSVSPPTVIAQVQQSTTTDGNGYWQFSLVPNTNISPANTTYTVLTPAGTYDVTLGAVGPYQSTALGTIVNVPVPLSAPAASSIPSLLVSAGEPGIDTVGAGALLLGDNTATSVEIGSGAVPININGQIVAVSSTGVQINAAGDISARSLTLSASSPYAPNLPGASSTPTPAGVTAGQIWDYGGMAYNVKAFNAKGDGVTDDTTALQNAINGLPANGGIVEIPFGNYLYTTLSYKYALQLRGAGGIAIGATTPATVLTQKSGTVDVLLKGGVAATPTSGVVVQDILFNASSNQASNTGGLYFLATVGQCFRVQVIYANTFAYKVQGGNTGGDAQNFTFLSCWDQNLPNTAVGFHILSSTVSAPDGTNILDCCTNSQGTWLKVDKGTASRGYGAEVYLSFNRLLDGVGAATPFNIDGYLHAIGNRFETTFGGGTLTCVINATTLTSPGGVFIGNSYAAPGGLVFTDNGAVRATRIGEIEPASVPRNQFSKDIAVGVNADAISSITFTGQRILKTNAISGPMLLQDGSGNGVAFLNAAGSLNTLLIDNSGNAQLLAVVTKFNNITTAGMGVPAIYAAAAPLTGQTAAVASIATLTSPNDGAKHAYEISGTVTITTLGSGSFNLQVSYTDSNGTARTTNIPLCAQAGTYAALANTADDYKGLIEIDVNPNTAVTIKTAGTFTGCTYNVSGRIKQVR